MFYGQLHKKVTLDYIPSTSFRLAKAIVDILQCRGIFTASTLDDSPLTN